MWGRPGFVQALELSQDVGDNAGEGFWASEYGHILNDLTNGVFEKGGLTGKGVIYAIGASHLELE
jgi:hypothetical protein